MIDLTLEKKYLHNFGKEKLIAKGAKALCGIESTYEGDGIPTQDIDLYECCPECLAKYEEELKRLLLINYDF